MLDEADRLLDLGFADKPGRAGIAAAALHGQLSQVLADARGGVKGRRRSGKDKLRAAAAQEPR